jgi:hypothetical protein
MILTIAPLLGASLIAASLTVDEYHNWVSPKIQPPAPITDSNLV